MKRNDVGEEDLITAHFNEHRLVVEKSLVALLQEISAVGNILVNALQAGAKVIALGNGGSAAQASHLVGELLGRFAQTRRPFPAIALASDPGVVTCIGNDFGFDALFERQIEALANSGDVVFGFTTSGRSENVKRGLTAAKKRDAVTVALTGGRGLEGVTVDYLLPVPSLTTACIQEVHLILLHIWCMRLDQFILHK
jgi:D-sedoheptulose 7-phosphate isomerase